jgi:hypothetical protein
MARFDDLPRASDALDLATRFRVACELSDAAIQLVRARLRRQHPEATDDQLSRMVDAWLETRPGAEQGDGVGRLVAWPRTRKA